jgi:DNA-binding SARP family transcriptional activator
MRVTLLGPVEGWADDPTTLVDLGTTRQRCVLAALLAGSGRPVTAGVLISRVWGDAPPATARTTLYSYIARIRRVLRGTRAEITRRSGGYQFQAPAGTVDLWRWDELRRQAVGAAGTRRVELLQAALELWCGRPLDNLAGAWVEQVRETLQQQRVELLADWADGMIELGRPAEVAERLAGPVSAAPSAERLVAARMRALQRMGRTAEALECFARSRRRTRTELGVEPSAPLRRLHLELLRS